MSAAAEFQGAAQAANKLKVRVCLWDLSGGCLCVVLCLVYTWYFCLVGVLWLFVGVVGVSA